jgi:hypothetical protein
VAARALRSFRTGQAIGSARPVVSRDTPKARIAAVTTFAGPSTKPLVCLLDDRCELYGGSQDDLHVICVSPNPPGPARSADAPWPALSACSGGVFVGAVSTVLALSACAAFAAFASRLPVSAGEDERECGIGIGRQDELVTLRCVAAVEALHPSGTSEAGKSITAVASCIVVVPPEGAVIISVGRSRNDLRHRARHIVLRRWRVGRCVIALENPGTHG